MKTLQNDYTTPEQSKRLLELGIPEDSANMILDGYIDSANRWVPDQYPRYLEHPYSVEIKKESELYTSNVLPCWSVGRLMTIYFISKGIDLWSPQFKKYQIENSAEYFVAIIANNIKDLDFSKLEE